MQSYFALEIDKGQIARYNISMKKYEERLKLPNTTMYFPKIELTFDEIDRLYKIGHVVPSWLRYFIVNTNDLDEYLKTKPKRVSKAEAINDFIKRHNNDTIMKGDLHAFSNGDIELIDLSVKYGLFYKDVKKVFTACLPNIDINEYWKNHKKLSQEKTTMAIYGVTHSSKDPSVEAKRKATMIERYGVDHNMKSQKLREQFRHNMTVKHGVEYAFELNTNQHSRHLDTHHYNDSDIIPIVKDLLNKNKIQHDINGNTIYITNTNLVIEINPNIEHNSNDYAIGPKRQSPQSKKKRGYHYNKYKLAKEKGITLIQWFGDDLELNTLLNVSFPRMLALIRGYGTKLYARNCQIDKLSARKSTTARKFINTYHSQGNAPASEYWGFYHNKTLIASASFTIKNDTAELKRLCFKPDTQIVGGLSKLINHFFKEHPNINSVTSFSDNNLGNGHGYQQAGATLLDETGPSLKYISHSDPTDTYSWAIATKWGAHKGVIAKDSNGRIFDSISDINRYVECELSHRTDDKKGYDKIYTAGSKKWIFNRPKKD